MIPYLLFSAIILVSAWLLYKPVTKDEPPCYNSYTKLGPFEFFRNPLEFARKARAELNSDVFSCWMLGKKMVFVCSKDNTIKLTEAEDNIMNFSRAYSTFIGMAFGDGVLTPTVAGDQLNILKTYLTDTYVESYIQPSYELARKLINKRMGSSGTIDLSKLLLEVSFTVGTRNFLGELGVEALKDYEYDSIFNGFEMGMQFVTEFIPFSSHLKGICDKVKPKSKFSSAIQRLVDNPLAYEQNNMLAGVLLAYHDKANAVPTFDKLVNLCKIICFGSGFNGYNMMSYFFRNTLPQQGDKDKKQLYEELRAEQEDIFCREGEKYSSPRLSKYTQLYYNLMRVMYANTFPFLLRYSQKPYQIGKHIVPENSLVAYSPQLEHDESSYIDDSKFNLIFGKGTHACPAKKYAKNTMMMITGYLIHNYDMTLLSAAPMVNNRLVTFPAQPSIWISYKTHES